MSGRKTYVVTCDGCGRVAFAAPTFPRNLNEVRADLANDGWTFKLVRRRDSGPAPTFDYCPACSMPKPAAEETEARS